MWYTSYGACSGALGGRETGLVGTSFLKKLNLVKLCKRSLTTSGGGRSPLAIGANFVFCPLGMGSGLLRIKLLLFTTIYFQRIPLFWS